jgi:hypothetical protein
MLMTTLIDELKNALPSRRMLDRVRFGAVKVGDKLVVLKNRYTFEPQEHLMIKYSKKQPHDHDYRELHGSSVLFDKSILNERGHKAIDLYLENTEGEK